MENFAFSRVVCDLDSKMMAVLVTPLYFQQLLIRYAISRIR